MLEAWRLHTSNDILEWKKKTKITEQGGLLLKEGEIRRKTTAFLNFGLITCAFSSPRNTVTVCAITCCFIYILLILLLIQYSVPIWLYVFDSCHYFFSFTCESLWDASCMKGAIHIKIIFSRTSLMKSSMSVGSPRGLRGYAGEGRVCGASFRSGWFHLGRPDPGWLKDSGAGTMPLGVLRRSMLKASWKRRKGGGYDRKYLKDCQLFLNVLKLDY